MLGGHLRLFGPVYVASAILIVYVASAILILSRRRLVKSSRRTDEDMISALPDDLLIKILLLLPTKDAVATVILSKRWQYIWTMLPQLIYKDSEYKQRPRKFFLPKKKKSIWWFLDQSLKLHKAPVLERLVIELGPLCPVYADDLRTCLENVVNRSRVGHLKFELNWLSEPLSLPESLYVSYTLVSLNLSYSIFVDVPCMVWLPCLEYLCLVSLEYKDEDAFVRLLSGCPVLKRLYLQRYARDNLTNVIVKVPSLKTLIYSEKVEPNARFTRGSLVIDSTALRQISIDVSRANSYSIENKPRLKKARLNVFSNLDDKFRRSLSSVMFLNFILSVPTVACCNTINFSQLLECKITPYKVDWLEPFMCFLQNSPNLKLLYINKTVFKHEHFPLSFNSPSFVPECLSNHLEIFEWEGYGGRNGEKEVVTYILANSQGLKRAGISIEPTWSCEDTMKLMEELKSMPRSISSQLRFSTQFEYDIPFKEETLEYYY